MPNLQVDLQRWTLPLLSFWREAHRPYSGQAVSQGFRVEGPSRGDTTSIEPQSSVKSVLSHTGWLQLSSSDILASSSCYLNVNTLDHMKKLNFNALVTFDNEFKFDDSEGLDGMKSTIPGFRICVAC